VQYDITEYLRREEKRLCDKYQVKNIESVLEIQFRDNREVFERIFKMPKDYHKRV